jgi:hypothetical protein
MRTGHAKILLLSINPFKGSSHVIDLEIKFNQFTQKRLEYIEETYSFCCIFLVLLIASNFVLNLLQLEFGIRFSLNDKINEHEA